MAQFSLFAHLLIRKVSPILGADYNKEILRCLLHRLLVSPVKPGRCLAPRQPDYYTSVSTNIFCRLSYGNQRLPISLSKPKYSGKAVFSLLIASVTEFT